LRRDQCQSYTQSDAPKGRLCDLSAQLDGVVIHEVGHAVGLAHNDGEPDYGGSAFLVDYDGYPTTMEPIIAGGSVLHLLDDPNAVWGNDWWNEVVVNENDREGMRDLYAPLADPEDFAVQAYWHDNLTTVLADQIECKAITGSKGLARPQPSTDLFSILEDFGYAYGTCPSGGWPAGVYVDRPAALPIQPFAIVEPSFTLLSLGDIGGSVEWQIHLKLDVNDEDCSDPGCYVLGTYISTVNSNQPYQREAQEVVIPPVPPGSYYLTAYMDSNDAWAESDETNQSAVWQQKLDVQANTCGCSASGPVSGAPGLALILLGFVRRRTRRETT
jgi:MYXO-CTERM domain-containing protein